MLVFTSDISSFLVTEILVSKKNLWNFKSAYVLLNHNMLSLKYEH